MGQVKATSHLTLLSVYKSIHTLSFISEIIIMETNALEPNI